MQWFELEIRLHGSDGCQEIADYLQAHIASPSVEDPVSALEQKDSWEAFDASVIEKEGASLRVWILKDALKEQEKIVRKALKDFEKKGLIQKGWQLIISEAADWMALAQEAYQVQRAGFST